MSRRRRNQFVTIRTLERFARDVGHIIRERDANVREILAANGVSIPMSQPTSAKYSAAQHKGAVSLNTTPTHLHTKALPDIGSDARVGDVRRINGAICECVSVNARPGELHRWRLIR